MRTEKESQQTLIDKIHSLSPEKVAEVEDTYENRPRPLYPFDAVSE